MSLTGGWRPVALSRDIEKSTSAGFLIEGQEVVVWRDSGGAAHAWEDRCPHRGMRLSFGFVRGNHIACLYHGWQFDIAGQCRHIPAHPALEPPRSITTWGYRCAERGGIVWVSGEDDASPAPPDVLGADQSVRSLTIAAPAEAVLDALRKEAGFSEAGPRLVALSAGADAFLIAIQIVSESRTTLHIVMRGSESRIEALRWAQRLRARIEEPDAVFYVAPGTAAG